MATITGLTKDRMLAIEAASIVDGSVDVNGDFVLIRHDGTEVPAGNVASKAVVEADVDSATVDVTVTGSGTPVVPYKIKADVKEIPADKVTSGTFAQARIPQLNLTQMPQITVNGILADNYRRNGPASVKIDGDSSYTPNVQWAVPYIPWGSRRVTLARFGSSWVIIGQAEYESVTGGHKVVPLTLGTNWYTYNKAQADFSWADGPYAVQLPSGLVVLSGLLRFTNGVPATDSVIASGIPTAMRPDFKVIHHVSNSDVAKSITITPTGEIQVRGTFGSNSYVSLDGVAYWPAGTATWTNIGAGGSGSAFGTNWGQGSSTDLTDFGTPAYYKDPYGFVWFRGIVKCLVATSVDNTLMVSLPVNHRTAQDGLQGKKHFRTTGNDGYAGVGATPTTTGNYGLEWKPNSPGTVGNWISLAGIAIPTEDAMTLNTWLPFTTYTNTWQTYAPGDWPVPAVTRRGDGLVMTKGLISAGVLGVGRATVLEREMWPNHGRLILETMSNNVRARLDVSDVAERYYQEGRFPGCISVINGSNTWFSLDGLKWITTP